MDKSEALSSHLPNGPIVFRGLPLTDTPLVSTSDSDPKVAQMAADVVRQVLPHWDDSKVCHNNATYIHAVTEVSPKPGLFPKRLYAVLLTQTMAAK